MEFYLAYQHKKPPVNEFQFPTGWNSTDLSKFFNSFREKFQFPTGWNSTFHAPIVYRVARSFNSQRDGILPRVGKKGRPFLSFQFPTGWNSTINSLGVSEYFESFNSQRDGILPAVLADSGEHIAFQFPTGWNSTQCKTSPLRYRFVSIPNGMEFYFI